MHTSIFIKRIEVIENTLKTLRKAGNINQATYTMLLEELAEVKQMSTQIGKQDIPLLDQQPLEKKLPLLALASKILFTLRGSLPTNDSVDTDVADQAISDTSAWIALNVRGLLANDLKPF